MSSRGSSTSEPPAMNDSPEIDGKVEIASKIAVVCGRSADGAESLKEPVRNYLKDKNLGSTPGKCLINDAIHGPIELSPLLFQIINTREFHRLKDVHQLGAAHYVYPGANHTRFDHSIGVCYLAGVFAKSLKEQLPAAATGELRFTDEEVLCAQIAGLCHDLGHGPFSHMFDYKVIKELSEGSKEHEELSVDIFKHMLANNPKVLSEFVDADLTADHVTLIGEMINPPEQSNRQDQKRTFLYEIVANKLTGIDVDKWDYYARDCHYLGVEHDFQWRRCMHLGQVVETPESGYKENGFRIAFRDKELDNLYGMFRTRALLHQKAYQHKTIKAVEKMIADAFILVQDLRMIQVEAGTAKSIKEAIDHAENRDNPELKWYLALTDSIVSTIQCAVGCTKETCDKVEKAQQLFKRIEERDLYSCVYTVRIPDMEDIKCHEGCPGCEDEETRLNLMIAKERLKSKEDKRVFRNVIIEKLKTSANSVTLTEDQLWVDVVKIKLPSEKKGSDPVKQVVFYGKSKSESELPKAFEFGEIIKKASKLVIPQAFIEYELRVYDTRRKGDRQTNDKDLLENAITSTLKEWREKEKSNN